MPNDMRFERKVTNTRVNKKKNKTSCLRLHEDMHGKFYFLNLESFNFRYNISLHDPPLGGFGEIIPSVMIFPSGLSSLRVIFRGPRRIPLAQGL